MKQGVCYIGSNENKVEALLELGVIRNSVVKVSVTLPPSIVYVQSIVTFSFDKQNTRSSMDHGLQCALV